MPNDYYDDGPEAPQKPEAPPPEQEDAGDEKTALLPKSVTGGKDFEPGDEIVLKVVAVHDDELEVSYATEKGESEGKPSSEPSMDKAMDHNQSMASFMED